MSETTRVEIVEIVGSGFCVASDDGQAVYEVIAQVLRSGNQVVLSFAGVEALTSAFLNVAVGQLYGVYPQAEIRAKLAIADACQDDLVLLKRVVDRAKEFFANPERFQTTAKGVLGDDSEP